MLLMTGAEIIPVGKAVLGAAHGAFVEDAATKNQLAAISKDSGAMKSAAESYARRVAIRQAVLLKLFAPLGKWVGASRSYFEVQFAVDLSEKISDIPEEYLAPPPPIVAVPAMQGLGYSLEEPDLKDMYLNLLATATDGRVQQSAHPSFAEIIKQLSGSEANLLRSVLGKEVHPIVRLKEHPIGSPDLNFNVVLNNLMNLRHRETGEPIEVPLFNAWIDNWARLGLVSVDYANYLSESEEYAWVDERPEVKRLRETIAAGRGISHAPGMARVTDFGQQFAAAVGIPRPSLLT